MNRICFFALFLVTVCITGCKKDDPVIPDPGQDVSFSMQVLPVFQQHGCVSCHGSSLSENGLRVDRVSDLLAGGVSGPAVIPNNAAGSLLIQKMSPNPPFGSRMPFGGAPVPDAQQNIIRRWIDEGAKNN
jgi:hypothetical protein